MRTAWPEVALGEVCTFNYGKSLPASSRSGEGGPVYGSNGVVGMHDVVLTDGPTIVIGRKGSFGEVHYSAEGCWPIDTTYYVDADATDADLRWLYYRLRELGLTSLNRAAAIPGLNREDAYRQRLLLPPIEEQRRIAAVLDQADGVRAKRRASLALLDSLTESIFLDMTHSSALETRVGDVLTFLTSGARGWAKYYADDGSRFVRSLDVRMGWISDEDAAYVDAPDSAEARRIRVSAGDVLLTITGSRIGRVAVAPPRIEGSFISQHVAILRFDESQVLPEFAAAYLGLASGGQRQIAAAQYGQTKPGLGFDQIRSFALPSLDRTRQHVVVDALAAAAALRLDAHLVKMDGCFASLQQRAFAGAL